MIFILLFIAKAEWLLIILNTHLPIHQNYVKTKLEVDLISVYYSAMIEQYPISAELFDHLIFTDADQLDIYEREVEASKHKLTCFDSTYNTTQIKMGLNNFQEIIKIKNNLSLVLDNTNLPCEGVVYDSIEPWITVMMQFSITKFYFYMKIFLIIAIVFSFFILLSAIILTQLAIRKLERKMARRSSFPRLLYNLQIK